MNNELHQETAKILAFPSRADISARRFAREARLIMENTAGLPATACGSAWYHDEAMRDEASKLPS